MTEGKRAIIFVGISLSILLLNQPVSSDLETDPSINEFRVSRVYERLGHSNSSITNQREIGRHPSDKSRFRSELSRRVLNAPLYQLAGFSFSRRSEERSKFERQRRIFRDSRNRRERNRVIRTDPALSERIQRRSMKTDFDSSRYFRFSEAPVDRNIRSTLSLPKSRFLTSVSPLTASNNRDRRIDSRIRDTRNTEFVVFRTRELERNINEFRSRTRSMRTMERDQNSNRVLSRNSETSSLVRSLFKSTLSDFPQNAIPSFESYQFNDFVVSTIAGILLYDIMGAMTQVADGSSYFGRSIVMLAFYLCFGMTMKFSR